MINNLLIKPSAEQHRKASEVIKVLDSVPGFLGNKSAAGDKLISKVVKQIKKVNEPVPRFFESPNQTQGYWAEGEYDLTAIFKYLTFESYFFKTVQKKLSQLIKSGFEVHSDDDEIKEYLKNRFLMMFLQTGISLDRIVKDLSYYLITCSNAWVIKVRDKNFEYAQSYIKDGKEMHPVVGLFVPHPTSMRPRFKWVRFNANGQMKSKLILEKWIFVNRRGIFVEFDPADVAHFTLYKEEGMVFGTPEIMPVIDDIKTLRKMEEDVQLLVYRDLFPILHYQVENPSVIDHTSTWTELDQAKKDMERIMQDGGIATDKRHEISFVGSQGKHLEIQPYLEYFQNRVLSGLGVSQSDMGLGQEISGNTANSMSKVLLDQVRFIQQEISAQFEEKILVEIGLQSPFGIEAVKEGSKPVLNFSEIDIEWRIRKENHEADLFTKGVKTIDEVRNPMGLEDFSDEHLDRTQHGLYEKPQLEAENQLAHKQVEVGAAKTITQIKHKASASKKKLPEKRNAADRDNIKAAKTNSNVVKSNRDMLCDEQIGIQDEFRQLVDGVDLTNRTNGKFNLMLATKHVYDKIKTNMTDAVNKGIKDACKDLAIESSRTKISNDLYKPLDDLRDSVVNLVMKDKANTNRAAVRVSTANRTEQSRAYNYGYAMTCVNNNKTDFVIYSDAVDIADDSMIRIGEELKINAVNIMEKIPPFRPNSRLKLKVKEINNGETN